MHRSLCFSQFLSPYTRSLLFSGSSIPYSTAWGSYTGSPAFTPAALFGNSYLTHSSLDTYSQLSPGGVGSSSVTPLPSQPSLTQVRMQLGTLIVFDLVIKMATHYTGCSLEILPGTAKQQQVIVEHGWPIHKLLV